MTSIARRHCIVALASAAAALGLAEPLRAQVLDEIVVTAQRREENLSDVPVSVTVITGAKIADADIRGLEELAAHVPNFTVKTDPIGDFINIRGIQSGDQAGFEQSVATFVDDIYRGRGAQSRWSFLDVERVEVLRGPQPAFFGNNSVAGALNIVTAGPTQELDAELLALYNPEFEAAELRGHVSGPLTESLRARGAFLSRQTDEGWVLNTAYSEHNPASDELFARVSLEWDASDRTLVSIKHEGGDFDVTGQPWIILRGGPISPLLAVAGVPEGKGFETAQGNNGFALLGLPGDPVLDFGSAGTLDGAMRETRFKVEHMLPSGALITGIAGLSQYDFVRSLDADFGPLPTIRFDDSENFEQSSLELRLTSTIGERFDYIAGLYLQDQDMYVDGLSRVSLGVIGALVQGGCAALPGAPGAVVVGDPVTTAVAVAGLPGSSASVASACGQSALLRALDPFGIAGVGRHAHLDQSTESAAVFAQITWNASDRVRVALGLRETSVDKEASQSALATDYASGDRTPLAVQSPTDPRVIGATSVLEFTPHTFVPSDPGMTRSSSRLTWSLNTQWDVTDATMVYASAGTAFKAGGFNSFYMGLPLGLGASSLDTDFEDEEVLSFEVGAKMLGLGGAAELNVAVFHTSYEDLQVALFSGDTTFIVQNAAEATARGVELEGRWRATDRLLLKAALGWLDFEYDRFPNQGCVSEQYVAFREAAFQSALAVGDQVTAGLASLAINNQVCAAAGINDLAGRPSAHSPDWTLMLGADYRWPIGRYELGIGADVFWSDDVYRVDDLDPAGLQSGYANVNAVLSLGPAGGDWDIALVGKNLTDEETLSFVNDIPLLTGARQAAMDPPRGVGLRGRIRF